MTPTLLLALLLGAARADGDPVAPVFPDDPPLPGESVAGWPGLGDAPVGPAVDIDTAVRAVLARHPELAALADELAAARADRAAATKVPGPAFEVEWTPDPEGDEVEARAMLEVRDLAFAAARRHTATATVEAEAARTRAAAVRLAYDVRVAFLDLQAAAAKRAIAERSLDAQAAARDLARALDQAGNLRGVDVVTQEAAYEMLRQQVAAIRLEEARARRRVDALLARADAWSPAPLAPLPADPALPTDAEARAEAASLWLAELDRRATALERQGRLALAEGIVPDLEVGAFTSWSDGTAGAVGLAIEGRLPLFGVGTASRDAAHARADATRSRRTQAVLDVHAAARAAVDAARIAHGRAAHLDGVVVPLQGRVLHETLLQYNAMQIGAWPLLQAVRAELDAASAAVDARRAWWVARAALDALLDGVVVDSPDTSAPTLAAAPAAGGH